MHEGMAMRRPRVLAFIEEWSPELAERELPAIHAQLRGLGAELAVVAKGGQWLLGPDDPPLPLQDPATGDRSFELTDGQMLVDALAAAGEAMRTPPPITFTRRDWALTSLYAGFAFALFGCKGTSKPDQKAAPPPASQVPPPQEYDIVLDINGGERKLKVEARVSLLDALRERLGLTGTKKGCDHGQCGACTVHLDGRRIKSCMQLAVMSQGQKIVTIEGLAKGDTLHPMQAAFVAHDGFQCGYCTPGQIMSAVAMLSEGKATTDAEVREMMSGNICRCGAYPNIIAAIQSARKGA
jgi:xanthine dehydrogenase YagT iron-sulfur-binding subunit